MIVFLLILTVHITVSIYNMDISLRNRTRPDPGAKKKAGPGWAVKKPKCSQFPVFLMVGRDCTVLEYNRVYTWYRGI